MTEREVFRVSARVIGLYFLALGAFDLFASWLISNGFQPAHAAATSDRAAFGAAWLISGFIVLLAADAISRLLYRRDQGRPADEDSKRSD